LSRISISAGQAWYAPRRKNHQHVGVVVDPRTTTRFSLSYGKNDARFLWPTRFPIVPQSLSSTPPDIDAAISNYFFLPRRREKTAALGESFTIQVAKIQDMRYGENPHQSAAFYETQGESGPSIARAHQIQAKSFPSTTFSTPTRRSAQF
jgi:phosphoribosylaminoimidazolecarboxamide formyltransferase/IMP cyclohydrolase